MNILLVIISRILFFILEPISFVYVNFIKHKFSYKNYNGFCKSSALNLDRYGNYEFRSLFNATLVKPGGYQFGNFNETVSSVLGKIEQSSLVILSDIHLWYPAIEFGDKWYKGKFCLRKKVITKYRRFVITDYTKTGIFINRVLNLIHKNHCIKAINDFKKEVIDNG